MLEHILTLLLVAASLTVTTLVFGVVLWCLPATIGYGLLGAYWLRHKCKHLADACR